MADVGGDPSEMTGGAATLHAVGTALQQLEEPVDRVLRAIAGHCGDDALAAAARRFAAAFGTVVADTGTQSVVAARLAANAATDLRRATGGSS